MSPNPFMVLLALVQLAAMGHEFMYGSKYVGALYFCYSVANILLLIIASKINN